ncbi:hypothetical protein [Chitinophaga caeni]|nr:hypothetical protein [Chitinophaga caeni]
MIGLDLIPDPFKAFWGAAPPSAFNKAGTISVSILTAACSWGVTDL